MQKVIIIGCPGSGKSTFGRKLSSVAGLPLYHLDMMYWNKDKTTVSKDVFIKCLKNIMSDTKWIIDGNYMSTMEMRLEECDTVFFLDYPTGICLDGIESRKGMPRSDMPWVENGETEKEFIDFVNGFNLTVRQQVLDLLEKYCSKHVVIFHSREESEEYLASLKKTM